MRVIIRGIEPPQPQAANDELVQLLGQGRLTDLIDRASALIEQAPSAFFHNMLGIAHSKLRRLDTAAACFANAVRIEPDYAVGHGNLGFTLYQLGHKQDAVACYERALAIDPGFAEAHNNLGIALKDLGRPDLAIACYERTLAIDPDHADAHCNMGGALYDLGRMNEAVVHLERALIIKPGHAEAHNNLGAAFRDLGRREEAVASFRHALTLKPGSAELHNNLAGTLTELGRRDEAIAHYERALAIRSDYGSARAHKLLQQTYICDWDGIDAEAGLIAGLGIEGESVFPSMLLPLEDCPERHLIRATRLAASKYMSPEPPFFSRPTVRPARLRIGYFSADFHSHATMHLMIRLFELHDHDRFDVRIYSYGPQSDDPIRQRLIEAVGGFHDVRSMGDREIAALSRQHGIDIAVDLKGYTQEARLGMFAWRCAPVQISYLGYPGTTGAPFIDYLVADRIVIPDDSQRHYSEKIIYLPGCYQVNDDTRVIPDMAMTRADVGLPADGFVFCCLNNIYKISPAEFDIWMRLLHQIEGSVLWLYKGDAFAEGNLREAARRRGIDPARLVWADHIPPAEHLARQRLADLFLDTFNVNAHTTASDALWAGLPVITKLGEGFAARVAGSLLNAVGLPDLVTKTRDEYENLALRLARNSDDLSDIRQRLAVQRSTAPLFNTELFCRRIEAAYDAAYHLHLVGEEPRTITIT